MRTLLSSISVIALASAFLMQLSVFPAAAYAQQESLDVTGVVRDTRGEPLAGVSVMVPGTRIGVSTGTEGEYIISAERGTVLRFSFIGFESEDITVQGNRHDVVLEEAAFMMEQVVVTGYSELELRKNTGSVAVISSEELKGSPLKTMDQLLQGKLAGVSVQATSGRPGAASKVRIRGTNTITGNAEPLWVIDGVPMQKNIPSMNLSQIRSGDFDSIFSSGIGSVNPNDIESITVLKDAAAAAIYGSQAANGVIVVTTRNGHPGRTALSYMGSVTLMTKPSRSMHLMDSREKLAWEQELWDEFSSSGFEATQNGVSTHFPVVGIVGQVRSGYGPYAGMSREQQDAYLAQLGSQSTDWFDVLFRNSVSTSHHLSVSGGSDKLTYYVSGGFSFDNGLVIRTNARSCNLVAKIGSRPAKWIRFGVQTDFSYQHSKAPSNNVNMFRYAYFANPYERLYNEDGSYRPDATYFSLGKANGSYDLPLPPEGFNIMREINETSSDAASSAFTLQGNATVNICKGLTFNGLASFTYNGDLSENINGKNTYAAFTDRPFEKDLLLSKRTYGSITQSSSFNTSYLLRGQLNYSRIFKDVHALSVIGGAEVRSSFAKSVISKRYGYDPVTGQHSTPLFPADPDGKVDHETLNHFGKILDACTGQSIVEDAFASFYGSLSYTYDSRYVVSGTIRSDGSNNFGNDQQFNANWSASAAWNIDEESWMQGGISNVVSSLSLRAGYGYTGGVNRTVFPVLVMDYLGTFRNTLDEFYRKGIIRNAPNPNLRWEKNRTFNIGLNFGLAKERVTGEISYYHNRNLDQVTSVRVPSSTGFDVQRYNTSEQVNHGVEIMLGATILKIKDFRWRLTANAAYNYNELTKYVSPTGGVLSDYYVGYPLGKIFTGKPVGIDPATGMHDFELRPDAVISDVSDYRKFENYLFYIGTSQAPWTGGFSTTFSYRNLSLNIAGNFSLGARIANDIVSPVDYGTAGGTVQETIPSSRNDLYVNHLNVVKDVTHRWTPEHPVTDGYPRLIDAYGPRVTGPDGYLDSRRPTSSVITDALRIENVSYLKISSVSISYELPQRWVKAMKMTGMNISFLANNLFIFTNYSGLDPETPGAVYPQGRSFSFNLNFSF